MDNNIATFFNFLLCHPNATNKEISFSGLLLLPVPLLSRLSLLPTGMLMTIWKKNLYSKRNLSNVKELVLLEVKTFLIRVRGDIFLDWTYTRADLLDFNVKFLPCIDTTVLNSPLYVYKSHSRKYILIKGHNTVVVVKW